MVAEPGVAPGIEDYESSVMLFHYPATGTLFIFSFLDFFFPKMRSQLSSNCFLGTLIGLGLLPLPPVLILISSEENATNQHTKQEPPQA